MRIALAIAAEERYYEVSEEEVYAEGNEGGDEDRLEHIKRCTHDCSGRSVCSERSVVLRGLYMAAVNIIYCRVLVGRRGDDGRASRGWQLSA